MAKNRYWVARTMELLGDKVARSQLAMTKRLAAPIQRRPNTSDLVQGMMMRPEEASPQGREALLDFAKDFYGKEVAETIMAPFILGPEEEVV